MEVVSYNSYAGFAKRLIAFVLDSMLVRIGIGMFFFRINLITLYYGHDGWDISHHLLFRHGLVVELITMAYFVFCESSTWQATLGKKLLGMKVVNEQYGRLSVKDAVIRFLTKYLSAAVLLLGYIWIIFDPKKQGWHDKIAGTYVIEA